MKETAVGYKNITLDVPFLGYFEALDVGYEKAVTSCGMCSVAMILSFKLKKFSLPELIDKGHIDGGYGPNGWIHDYFVNLLTEYQLPAERFEHLSRQDAVKKITTAIAEEKPVIISGRKMFMEQTSFHMVLIVGYQINESGVCTGFFYHDPALTKERGAMFRFVPIETFHQYWRQMAIMLR
jgi:hypothetical protein